MSAEVTERTKTNMLTLNSPTTSIILHQCRISVQNHYGSTKCLWCSILVSGVVLLWPILRTYRKKDEYILQSIESRSHAPSGLPYLVKLYQLSYEVILYRLMIGPG